MSYYRYTAAGNDAFLHIGEQQLRSIVKTVMQAFLKVSHHNPSKASMRVGASPGPRLVVVYIVITLCLS